MEERLYEAAVAGDVKILEKLLQEDSRILDKAVLKCSDNNNRTPLHMAAMLGHENFAMKISEVSSDMCLARDRDGRNPLHLAAIKGKGEVLEVLLQARLHLAARERADGGGTILHLCVKYNQLEMLKILVQVIKDSEFLNAMNDEGMTVLHLAVLHKQIETIRCLAETNIDVNKKNANDKTALDIARNLNLEMAIILEQFGALAGSEITAKGGEWLDKKRDAIMIVATLIATFAFHAGLNPPGGVWQEDSDPLGSHNNNNNATMAKRLHKAGEAVMAYNYPKYYKDFVTVNTVVFFISLSTILFLISGLPFKHKFIVWCLLVTMWLTVTFVALTYVNSITSIIPEDFQNTSSQVIELAIMVWLGIMSLPMVVDTIQLIRKWMKGREIKKMRSRIRKSGAAKGPAMCLFVFIVDCKLNIGQIRRPPMKSHLNCYHS